MAVRSFTAFFEKVDADVAADALAAILNVSADKEKYVAICEVRVNPKAINDDTTNILGNQGILSMDRITAASGGSLLSPMKYDTAASNLPSQVQVRRMPTSVTLSGGTIRRFGDCVSTMTVAKAIPFQAMMRAPGVVDGNDHSGRSMEGQNIWHVDGISDTEPIVLREGEGFAIVKRAFGVPQAQRIGIVLRVVSTGNTYRWRDSDIGTPDLLGTPLLSVMNESGSGIVLQVEVVSMPDIGEENIPRYRIVRCEATRQEGMGEAVTLGVHDTAASITEVEAYRGPMRIYAWPRGEGVQVDYFDYQTGLASIATQQKVGCFRQWLGAGPWMRTTSSPQMVWDVLSRAEPDVWPGDRRGVGGGLAFPLILRPGQGLAVMGGGNGLIETSEIAYLDIEICGYVYTPNAVYPAENDVDLNVLYGPNGNDYSGDLVQPAQADVKSGVGYGADGTEFTGTYVGGGGATYSRGRVVNP